MFAIAARIGSIALSGAVAFAFVAASIVPTKTDASVAVVAPPAQDVMSEVKVLPATYEGVIAVPTVLRDGPPLQCAIYAKQRTGLDLSGDAGTWWAKADGKYKRAHAPIEGAVIVMGGTSSGHVGVVSRVLSKRDILVDHANWMNQGEIQLGAQMHDISPNNDWSQVQVWHVPSNALGLKPYPVMGFVLPDRIDLASLPTRTE